MVLQRVSCLPAGRASLPGAPTRRCQLPLAGAMQLRTTQPPAFPRRLVPKLRDGIQRGLDSGALRIPDRMPMLW